MILQAFSFRNITQKFETARDLCKYLGNLRKIIAALFKGEFVATVQNQISCPPG